MLRVAKRHDLWVLCDEAYEEIYFDTEPPDAVWKRSEIRDRAIAFHTLSKTYGFAGARVGFTHGPESVMTSGARNANLPHVLRAPPHAVRRGEKRLRQGGAWIEESRSVYRDAGYEAADALGVPRPAGGTFLFMDVSEQLDPGDTDCTTFLERCADAGVLLTPGRSCGADYAKWVRLCFTSVPPAQLAAALKKLAPLLSEHEPLEPRVDRGRARTRECEARVDRRVEECEAPSSQEGRQSDVQTRPPSLR